MCFPCATASLLNNDNQQTCLRDGKTLKVVLCNFTFIFKVFQIDRDSGNFLKTLKILVKLILNCPRPHAITYSKRELILLNNRDVNNENKSVF